MPSSTTTTQTFQLIRQTHHTSIPFATVISNLYGSIGDPSTAPAFMAEMREITSSTLPLSEKKEKFVKGVEERVGKDGFTIFGEIDHTLWPSLFAINPRQLGLKRVILGNPLIAATMLRQSLAAGLAVPVEVLVMEREDGGTDVVWNEPSGLVCGNSEDLDLVEAAMRLDDKLEALVVRICGAVDKDV